MGTNARDCHLGQNSGFEKRGTKSFTSRMIGKFKSGSVYEVKPFRSQAAS
jgi:hypothetical protein